MHVFAGYRFIYVLDVRSVYTPKYEFVSNAQSKPYSQSYTFQAEMQTTFCKEIILCMGNAFLMHKMNTRLEEYTINRQKVSATWICSKWHWICTRAAPHNSARSLRQDFCSNSKFRKWRNTVCISHFRNCGSGAKRRLRLADAIVRCCLNFFEAAISSSLAFLGCLLRGITFRHPCRCRTK